MSALDVERVLRENGISESAATTMHSWRCAYPDTYGPCTCFQELVAELATREAEAVRAALEAAAEDMDRFRAEVYSADIFKRPSVEDYAAANVLLKENLGWSTDRIGADCYDRAISIQADRLRALAAERGSEQ